MPDGQERGQAASPLRRGHGEVVGTGAAAVPGGAEPGFGSGGRRALPGARHGLGQLRLLDEHPLVPLCLGAHLGSGTHLVSPGPVPGAPRHRWGKVLLLLRGPGQVLRPGPDLGQGRDTVSWQDSNEGTDPDISRDLQ